MRKDRHVYRKAGNVWAVGFDGDALAAWELRELIIHARRRRRWVSRVTVGECLQAAIIWGRKLLLRVLACTAC